jgi:hypothetical protein
MRSTPELMRRHATVPAEALREPVTRRDDRPRSPKAPKVGQFGFYDKGAVVTHVRAPIDFRATSIRQRAWPGAMLVASIAAVRTSPVLIMRPAAAGRN